MIKKKLLIGLVFCMTLSLTTVTAFATDTVITGGSLSVTPGAIATFIPVTLNGTVQTTTTTFASTDIVDSTGSGSGWNVKIDASVLTNATAPVGFTTLPASSLAIAATTVTAAAGASADSPTDIVKSIGTIDDGTGLKVLSAIANQGMGTYTANFGGLTLTLNPKDVYAGTYTTTITTTLTSTP